MSLGRGSSEPSSQTEAQILCNKSMEVAFFASVVFCWSEQVGRGLCRGASVRRWDRGHLGGRGEAASPVLPLSLLLCSRRVR